MNLPNERLAKSLARLRPHGTRTRYEQGCRCFKCRRVKAYLQLRRREERLSGAPSNKIIPAGRAQTYLLELREQGVGMKTIEEYTGINKTILKKVRRGVQKHLREANERKILAVTPDMKINSSKVPSTRARQMVLALCRDGFTTLEIGRRLGLKTSLQIPRKGNILASTEMRIEKFYNMIMAEEAA